MITKQGWRWLSFVQAGLPIAAAAALAGFTWWLVQSSPQPETAKTRKIPPTTPDYVLHTARVSQINPQGQLQAVIDGRQMRHYPSDDHLEIDQVRVSARGDQGDGLQAKGAQGIATSQGEVVRLIGGADVLATPAREGTAGAGARQEPIRFNGEELTMNTQTRVLTSDQPLTITQVHNIVHAKAMRYDDVTGITDLKGRVTGRYELQSK